MEFNSEELRDLTVGKLIEMLRKFPSSQKVEFYNSRVESDQPCYCLSDEVDWAPKESTDILITRFWIQ